MIYKRVGYYPTMKLINTTFVNYNIMDDYSQIPTPRTPPVKTPVTSPIINMPTEILQLILDPSQIIERISHDLKGETGPYLRYDEVEDGAGNKTKIPVTFWKTDGQRDMNDKGVESVISMLNKYINRNTIFSQLTEDEVYKITKVIDRNLTAMFAAKYKEYEIDINRMSIVKDGIADMCFFALKQSQNKALMDALTKLVTVSEVKDSSPTKMTLGDLSPFKKRM